MLLYYIFVILFINYNIFAEVISEVKLLEYKAEILDNSKLFNTTYVSNVMRSKRSIPKTRCNCPYTFLRRCPKKCPTDETTPSNSS
ncbi:hypothetical protein CVS40_3237 [Lucilia cuprina]|nr:hypothetical protein CVS40_3237 [Lucilia cuprina]